MAISEKEMRWLRKYSDKELDEYEQSLDDLEKKGTPVQDYRDAVAEIRASRSPEARQRASEAYEAAEAAKRASRVYRLERLAPHYATPRDPNSAFFKDNADRSPWLFGKRAWLEEHVNLDLIHAAVVQASNSLWEPGEELGGAVIVTSHDPAYKRNTAWLKAVAGKLQALRDSTTVPDDCKKLVKLMRDEHSDIEERIPASLTDGVEAWATVLLIDQSKLPHACLTEEAVVPLLVRAAPADKVLANYKLIQGQYYS